MSSQFQPSPTADPGVMPGGAGIVTVTGSVTGPAVELAVTVTPLLSLVPAVAVADVVTPTVRSGGSGVTGVWTVIWVPVAAPLPGVETEPVAVSPSEDDPVPGQLPGTVTPIWTGGKLCPGCRTSPRVQVTVCPLTAHCQPEPAADVTSTPSGTLNVTVTGPVVGPPGAALEATSV